MFYLKPTIFAWIALALLISIRASSAFALNKSDDENELDNPHKILTQSPQTKRDSAQSVLSLDKAISQALINDEWIIQSRLQEQGLLAQSEGALALPDPTLSFGLLNMPTDGFAFNQEPMTQFKIGASQVFPRGDSRQLEKTKFESLAANQVHQRQERRKQVALQTSLLWLDAFKAAKSYMLINDTQPLFTKLAETLSAKYAASSGNTRQQDIINADVELVRLQDRLIDLRSKQRSAMSQLSRFIFRPASQPLQGPGLSDDIYSTYSLPATLAENTEIEKQAILTLSEADAQTLYTLLAEHPRITSLEQNIKASGIEVDIAKQDYKPQYGVNASYALRDDAATSLGGASRADFFSVGVNVSLPLFSSSKQDAQVSSRTKRVEALRTSKRLLFRELISALQSALQQYKGSAERETLYELDIIPKIKQQSEAALTAYTNDRGDFSELIRSQIAQLDAVLTLIDIRVAKRQAHAKIIYFLGDNIHSIDSILKGQSHE